MTQTEKTPTVVLELDGIKGIQKYLSQSVEIIELTLRKGAKLKRHALPVKVVFYVLQGSGVVSVDDLEQRAECGEIVECPANAMRLWKNNGSEKLKILAIKQLKEV